MKDNRIIKLSGEKKKIIETAFENSNNLKRAAEAMMLRAQEEDKQAWEIVKELYPSTKGWSMTLKHKEAEIHKLRKQ
jgi:endonuclease III